MRFRIWRLTVWVSLALILSAGGASSPAGARGPMYTYDQRFGVALVRSVFDGTQWVTQNLADYDLAGMHVGWFSDWGYAVDPPNANGGNPEYVQLIDVRASRWPPDWSKVRQAAEINPGSIWIIGNEPEGRINQGNRTPAQYAEIYRTAYYLLKGYDRDSQVAIGGVIEPTPLRLRWLRETLDAYQAAYGEPMPVDIWNIHVQILEEDPAKPAEVGAGIPAGITPQPGEARFYSPQDSANPEIFKILVSEFRAWMAANGQREVPLIISEYGVLMPSDYLASTVEEGDRLVEQYMVQTFDWLLNHTSDTIGCPGDGNRLVQRWLWYSLNDAFYDCYNGGQNCYGFNGSLFDYRSKRLTRFGRVFRAFHQRERLNMPILTRQYGR